MSKYSACNHCFLFIFHLNTKLKWMGSSQQSYSVSFRKKLQRYYDCFLFRIVFPSNRAFRLVLRFQFIFAKQQLLLAEVNHVIYSNQSQLLLAKTIEDQTLSRKALYQKLNWIMYICIGWFYMCSVLTLE